MSPTADEDIPASSGEMKKKAKGPKDHLEEAYLEPECLQTDISFTVSNPMPPPLTTPTLTI